MSPLELRKNGHVVINGRPCKIVEIEASQSTISLDGIDIFTGQLHKCTLSTDEDVDVPNVTRDEYMLVCPVIASYVGRELNLMRSISMMGS